MSIDTSGRYVPPAITALGSPLEVTLAGIGTGSDIPFVQIDAIECSGTSLNPPCIDPGVG